MAILFVLISSLFRTRSDYRTMKRREEIVLLIWCKYKRCNHYGNIMLVIVNLPIMRTGYTCTLFLHPVIRGCNLSAASLQVVR